MANLSNEFGISKNRKIEILLEMGYELCDTIKDLYRHPKKSGTGHWFQNTELDSYFFSNDNFKDFVRIKLNK
jgi:hypothetical protein